MRARGLPDLAGKLAACRPGALIGPVSKQDLSAQLLEKELERHVVETATKLGLRPSAIPDLKARSRAVFQVVGGAVAAVEADGQTPVCGADGVTPLTFDEWVTRPVAEAPHLFEFELQSDGEHTRPRV